MVEETIPAATVEYLKVEEYDAATVAPRQERRQQRRAHRPQNFGRRFARRANGGLSGLTWVVIGLAALFVLGAFPALNWWGVLLLWPAASNFKAYRADRAAGLATRRTRSALRRTLWSLAFMFVVLFSAWEVLIPLLLIGWGFALLAVRSQQTVATPVY